MDRVWGTQYWGAQGFRTTQWGLLTACRNEDPLVAGPALGELCQSYWYPIYAAVRHSGRNPTDAKDLTQEFFLKILKGRWVDYLDQSKGRFRAYLLTALKHFLRDSHRRWTLRRGRGYALVSIDVARAESMYALEPATQMTPETLYEQKWAALVITHTLEQLQIELRAGRRPGLFECFRSALFSEMSASSYKETATRLGMEVGALQTAMSRLRQRFRSLLRDEVARTLSLRSEAEIDAEVQHLVRVGATRL